MGPRGGRRPAVSRHTGRALRAAVFPAAAALLAAGCGGSTQFGSESTVKTAKAQRGKIEVLLTEVGSIEPESRVEVKSLLGGKVKEVSVVPGQTVKSGQILATVEPEVDQIRNLSQLRTQLSKARMELRNTEIDRKNVEELAAKNFASAEDVRELERRHEAAKVDFQTLQAQVRLLEDGGISLPSGDGDSGRLQAFRIIAPSDGVILEARIQPGEVVSSGTFAFGGGGSPLFVLADLAKLLVKATVNEVDVGKVSVGQAVTLSVDAYRGEAFEGKLTRISPGARLFERVRVFDVEVKPADARGLLRPGMTANVDIHGEKKEAVLKVPIEGVFRKKGKDVAYLAKKLSEADRKKKVKEAVAARTPVSGALSSGFEWEEREVKTGLASVEEIEIVSGLKEGDDIFLEDPTLPKKESNF